MKILISLNYNSLEVVKINLKESKKTEQEKRLKLNLEGHRMPPRGLCFSKNGLMLISISNSELKCWDIKEQCCIQTFQCEKGISCIFGPTEKYIFVSSKNGHINIFDVQSSNHLKSIFAHKGAVWGLDLTKDKTILCTAGVDHEIKFWNLLKKTDKILKNSTLNLIHVRTLELTDEVLSLKISDDRRILACSLLDQTIRVFYFDTLKFFLSMYGHNLPVLCLDISTDGKLLISGSADKNIKIWGLDFGDLHKSLFAHNNMVTSVKFVPKTHCFFSAGKDLLIKYWDGNKFEKILTLKGHQEEISSLAVSSSGLLASCGIDQSIRIWEETNEELILEEEQEKELREMFDRDLIQINRNNFNNSKENSFFKDISGQKTSLISIKTKNSGEKICLALDMITWELKRKKKYIKKNKDPDKFNENLGFLKKTPMEYLLQILMKIEAIHLEEALMILSFDYALQLLAYLEQLLDNYSTDLELILRCLLFIIREHQVQIRTTKDLRPLIERLRTKSRKMIKNYRDKIGFNLSGLYLIQKKRDFKNPS